MVGPPPPCPIHGSPWYYRYIPDPKPLPPMTYPQVFTWPKEEPLDKSLRKEFV